MDARGFQNAETLTIAQNCWVEGEVSFDSYPCRCLLVLWCIMVPPLTRHLIFRPHIEVKPVIEWIWNSPTLYERFPTVPARLMDSSNHKVNGISDSPFLINVFKGDDVFSFFHGFWFIGLMMARKMGQN